MKGYETIVLAAAATIAACGSGGGGRDDAGTDAGDAPDAVELPQVSASGNAFHFGPPGGRVEGAEVTVLELPGLSTVTGEEGEWSFDGLPGDAQVSFVMAMAGFPVVQTGTIQLAGEDIEQVSFQAPPDEMFEFIANLVGITPDPEMCQIASTVTRIGNSLYDTTPGTHGEPGAVVTIDPDVPRELGPIYFNLVTYDTIFPDPDLTETSDDGGVLFVNVPEGVYTLRATKPDTVFTEVTITCRAGVLVNASPPWGIQAIEGGVGPRE